jgi:glycosyltransferase involved in cell wall biosynthesis
LNNIFEFPKVAILMGTLNGEKFLYQQLETIRDQTYKNWILYISDDGSSDKTIDIIQEFKNEFLPQQIELISGPGLGFAYNFMTLALSEIIKADYYFFSDQDDIWNSQKIDNALNIAKQYDNSIPFLYGSRTSLGDVYGNIYGESNLFLFPDSFRNAIVQCIVGGNTLAFNQSFKNILLKTQIYDVVSHDWWLYQLITGIGGNFYYDTNTSLVYRQHPDALVGENTSIISKLNRIYFVLNGRYKRWNESNIQNLQKIAYLLNKESKDTLLFFSKARQANKLRDRFRLLNISGVFRQTRKGTVALFLAAILNKI